MSIKCFHRSEHNCKSVRAFRLGSDWARIGFATGLTLVEGLGLFQAKYDGCKCTVLNIITLRLLFSLGGPVGLNMFFWCS